MLIYVSQGQQCISRVECIIRIWVLQVTVSQMVVPHVLQVMLVLLVLLSCLSAIRLIYAPQGLQRVSRAEATASHDSGCMSIV